MYAGMFKDKVAVVFGVLRTVAEFVRDAPSLAVIFG